MWPKSKVFHFFEVIAICQQKFAKMNMYGIEIFLKAFLYEIQFMKIYCWLYGLVI